MLDSEDEPVVIQVSPGGCIRFTESFEEEEDKPPASGRVDTKFRRMLQL
jgi:hypothetical protein